MQLYYDPATAGFYDADFHTDIPATAVAITEEKYQELLEGNSKGRDIACDEQGQPYLQQPAPPSLELLCKRVDTAADRARRAVAGDPLRAVEYDRARVEAEQFAAAGYQGDVPPMVAAWAISGRTAQQAADSILAEAAQYTAALVQLRTTRLQAKELIRAAMAAGNQEQAEDIAAETIAAIEAAVAGIGNNA
ncbi:phage tail protein [Stutzerimonas frequens]|uniref:Phage tail protein n=1 Tax=Stutzerimonas frequens TaxID=2968969 RepID=A0ABX6XY99_9GAMM|nr:phage tail protein [Stutzerimonas frequens]MCQ4302676.1 phage tail protein [Stutzerimonas frequens]PNF52559.1 phage tail protein [Stutzerimonas frequens]QPT19040.1 phage tail protein [Stutzerimonas frequens]